MEQYTALSWTIRHHQPPAQHRGHESGGLETCTYSAARLIRTPHLGLSLLQLRVSSCCDNSELMMTSTLSLRRTSNFINEYRYTELSERPNLQTLNYKTELLNLLILRFSGLKPQSSALRVSPAGQSCPGPWCKLAWREQVGGTGWWNVNWCSRGTHGH